MERWYYRTALIFWPKSFYVKVLNSMGRKLLAKKFKVMLPKNLEYSQFIKEDVDNIGKTTDVDFVNRFAKEIVELPNSDRFSDVADLTILQSLAKLNIFQYFDDFLKISTSFEPICIIEMAERHGWNSLQETITNYVAPKIQQKDSIKFFTKIAGYNETTDIKPILLTEPILSICQKFSSKLQPATNKQNYLYQITSE